MEKLHDVTGDSRPAIRLIDSECDALYALALTIQPRKPDLAAMLLAELDRAEVYAARDLPDDVVTMGSRVEFVDENSLVRRTVELVYPQHADIAAGRVSILSPVGVGLIGMRAGSSILWPDRERHLRTLRIVRVFAPERTLQRGEAALATS
ncbi:nucleoside diphosphate kinase regulator [Sphingomonas sp. M1-B02]|uniref:nucleoside diphosphate kinase regulator n=1 Tax=Sphingomonas sp. M1-B02 TaxID=3114300 RepID=UPI002240A46D|nr:nucleoside diphosphate kinase regulator [Sphingomonas sp. S6-11]UZK66841.1 nucleoside diphosphate kinase regulator [Sphingomonas sp. S6-11]